MIRVLVVEPPGVNGVTWWRSLRPLTEMSKTYPDMRFRFATTKAAIHEIMDTDVLIMFRPISEDSLRFLENCKAKIFGLKVILDIDDNLWRLPPGHPGEMDYMDSAATLRQIYATADGIWCSTDPIMDFADARDGRGVVVPNAVLPRELPNAPSPYKGIVCWRGDIGQFADFSTQDAADQFSENRERFSRWLFWGYWPKFFRGDNVKGLRRSPVETYIASLPGFGMNIMWKPLEKNQFNDAKSNIAWIEATMAGAICVTNYAGQPGWEMAVDRFTDNPDFIASQWAASKEWVLKHYNLKSVNEIRYQHILKTLGV